LWTYKKRNVIPAKAVILMEPFILRYGKFNTNPTDTPIPLLTSPLKGEEHNDFPPLQGEGGGGLRWVNCLSKIKCDGFIKKTILNRLSLGALLFWQEM
jgi:hypothetical protein